MISSQHFELIYIFKYLFLAGLYAASIPHTDPAKFSMSSLYDSTLSMIHPVVAAGSNRCEAFKSFFGITYEQMQEKNKSNFHEVLNIDLITKNGNIKYNLTATNRINRLMAHAQTIVILVHGFMESSEGWMVNAIAPELLKKPELKVFALDGRKVINLEYFRSSTNVRFMGELLGMFLADVIKGGQDPSKIYIVGHSLGSHIAGVAGKKVHELTGKLIGRITALDPAGPCFSNVSASGRLDKTDAEYVDVIHSNGGFLGLKEPLQGRTALIQKDKISVTTPYTNTIKPLSLCALSKQSLLTKELQSAGHCSKEELVVFTDVLSHKDFYPNGGISQPGCYISICDHSRAWELFSESVASPKHFPACPSKAAMLTALCCPGAALSAIISAASNAVITDRGKNPEDAEIGACLAMVSAPRMRYPTWVLNLTTRVQVFTSSLLKTLRLLAWVPLAVDEGNAVINFFDRIVTTFSIIQYLLRRFPIVRRPQSFQRHFWMAIYGFCIAASDLHQHLFANNNIMYYQDHKYVSDALLLLLSKISFRLKEKY